ncbi:cytochrome P450 [Acidisarcina polymorpha]|nr:cytochrome P450 [Acidisarcina polymorpha]
MDEALPRVVPPAKTPGLFALLRLSARNPIEVWPREVYEEDLFHLPGPAGGLIFLSAPELVQEALVSSVNAFGRSKEFLDTIRPLVGNSIVASDGPRWRFQRSFCAPLFRPEQIDKFSQGMLDASVEAAERLIASSEHKPISLLAEMMHLSLTSIAKTMLSDQAMLNSERVIGAISNYLKEVPKAALYSTLGLPKWILRPGKKSQLRARDFLHIEMKRIIDERKARGLETGRCPDDLLDLLLSAEKQAECGAFGEKDVLHNLLTFVAAGYETTGVAMAWTIYLVSLHPETENLILAELDEVTRGEPIKPCHLNRLVYLRQVVSESLRLYPPIAAMARRVVEPVTIGGNRLDKNTTVMISPYVIHRHRKLWDYPDHFNPDNFSPSRAAGRHRYAYLPFGAGQRICIGMSFAMTEMLIAVGTLVRTLRFSSTAIRPPNLQLRIALHPSDGLPMRATRRGQVNHDLKAD